MKKIKVYHVPEQEVIELECYETIIPDNGKKIYFFDYEEAYSLNEEEFSDYKYFHLKENALEYIKDEFKKEQDFEKACFNFKNLCETQERNNPFISIGAYYKKRDNKKFVDSIEDKMIKQYVSFNISHSSYLSELEKKLL